MIFGIECCVIKFLDSFVWKSNILISAYAY